MNRVKFIVVQLGSPKNASPWEVRSFLRDFIGDPRVVDLPRVLWLTILYCFILTFRPFRSAKAYKRIWTAKGFPLIFNTFSFVKKLNHYFKQHNLLQYEVNAAFVVSEPSVSEILQHWHDQRQDLRADKIIVLPQYPQYSETTTASVYDRITKAQKKLVNLPRIEMVPSFHCSTAFIDQSVKKIQHTLDSDPVGQLIISFHGVPLKQVREKADLYFRHCCETFVLIRDRVQFPKEKIHLCFQSRFGPATWTAPATDATAIELAKKGAGHIAVYCPSFTVDCLETIDEIGEELAEEVQEYNCKITAIACLNDDDEWVTAYAKLMQSYIEDGFEQQAKQYYSVDIEKIKEVREKTNMAGVLMSEEKSEETIKQEQDQTKKQKGILKLMFLTLFLDLVGFSIIFPFFPRLAAYYLQVDASNPLLNLLIQNLNSLISAGQLNMQSIVLFGTVLGAIYSLCQFVAAPLWGSLSDRVGRRPIMVLSLFGLLLSYILWFFSGSFTVLLAARLIGGLMGGNLSVASAIVSDITDKKSRSKGMAVIGIAFALGFIMGPAIGGALGSLNLLQYYPSLALYGVNPFSMPAAFAALLSFLSLALIYFKLPETLPEKLNEENQRSANIVKILFAKLPTNVRKLNWAYFIYICAFSGMEFTLTFLAVERLRYTPMQNAYMFVFIGFVLVLVQGGFVRRKAHQYGEKNIAMLGHFFIIPGLFILAEAYSSAMLYTGLALLAIGSSLIIPTMTALASLWSSESIQGRALGVFRSLGALGRVFGPLIIGVAYWKLGANMAYYLGAMLLVFPVIILLLTKEEKEA